MKTVFFYYNDVQKEKYWTHEDYVFFDEQGWWMLVEGARHSVSPYALVEDVYWLANVDIVSLIHELRSWGPVWARSCGRGDQQEILLREAMLMVLVIAAGLKKLCVGLCVMHTGVSHHIDSAVFQMACQRVAVKPVFLYAEILATRLLPLLQEGAVDMRQSLGRAVSDFGYASAIQDFLDTKLLNLPPKNNMNIGGRALSWQWSIPYFFCKDMVQLLRVLQKKLVRSANRKNVFELAHNTYPFQFTIQALQQKSALHYLREREKPADQFLNLGRAGNSPRLILAAHYQPEATSFPEGGNWGNHVDVALEVFKKGYQGILLYKEHPATFLYLEGRNSTSVSVCRSKRYYEQLEWIGCEFLESSIQLSLEPGKNYWYLPITITGSIAVERALAGYHTVVAGHPWFKGMPGVLQLSELESLTEIKRDWVTPNPILAASAFQFLDNLLSGKTITNVPGIGTGKPLTGQAHRSAFANEFAALLQAVKG